MALAIVDVEGTTPAHFQSSEGKASIVAASAGSVIEEQRKRVAVIDDRVLLRECFANSIETARAGISVVCFSTIEEWQAIASDDTAVSLILLCCSSRRMAGIRREIEALSGGAGSIPVIVVSDEEDANTIREVIRLGARGFIISASIDLRLALVAMELVRAGGIYLPESILRSLQHPQPENNSTGSRHSLLTERQAAVVDVLLQGKPNKIIAYELNMAESTVKVHLRTIMKKLNAKNRTEVVIKMNNAGAATRGA